MPSLCAVYRRRLQQGGAVAKHGRSGLVWPGRQETGSAGLAPRPQAEIRIGREQLDLAQIAQQAQVTQDLIYGLPKEDVFRIIEMLVLGIVAVMVILLVIRPLLARALEDSGTVAKDEADRVTCRGCRFWQRDKTHAHEGECRKHAPGPSDARADASMWPRTGGEDWCGDAQPLKPAE